MNDFAEQNLEHLELIADLASARPTVTEGHLTVDVYQTDKEVVIQSTIAGITADDLDISIAKDIVTIKGKREQPEKVRSSAYDHRELYWGPFSRSIILPVDINVDRAKAVIKNGLLTIHLPKL